MAAELTEVQRRILEAIEGNHLSTRAIAQAAGISSTSVVASHLRTLADGGHIVLRRTTHGLAVARGLDFCTAWDAACRLAGNPDA
jgi:hypothetical protein